MKSSEDESAWEDIGNKPKALARIPFSPIPDHKHDSDEFRESNLERNLRFILEIDPEAKPDDVGMIEIKIRDKVFLFWPKTNCYFIPSTTKYGTGIEKLCKQIKDKLIQKEV